MKICVRRGVGLVAIGIWAGFVGLGWGQEPIPPASAKAGSSASPQNDNAKNGGGSGKRAMTFADLMAMKRVSDPQISASGKWVMFSVMDVDLGKNTKTTHLWVVPLGSG